MPFSNIQQAGNGLTPWFLRSPVFGAFRDVVMNVLDVLFGDFYVERDTLRKKLDTNSQIIYLEYYLNVVHFGQPYDPATRAADISGGTIVWIESANKSFLYVYNKSEGRPPRYLYNKSESLPTTYLNNRSEFLASNHFTVWIPVAWTFDNAIMESIIDFFKLASKTYDIQTY